MDTEPYAPFNHRRALRYIVDAPWQHDQTATARNCNQAGIGLIPKHRAQDLPLRGQRRVRTDFPFK